MPEANQWTRTTSPFIAAADSEAVYWTGATIDGTPAVLHIDRAITAEHAFVTVAEVTDPGDPEAVLAAAEHGPQICVPLSVLAGLGQHFAEVRCRELGLYPAWPHGYTPMAARPGRIAVSALEASRPLRDQHLSPPPLGSQG